MVRRWAHEQGIAVADRGRIPRSVMEQYVAEVAPRSDGTGGRSPKRRRSDVPPFPRGLTFAYTDGSDTGVTRLRDRLTNGRLRDKTIA